jgi:2,3-dihydroxybiphenyl 1,2-dioxygenase
MSGAAGDLPMSIRNLGYLLFEVAELEAFAAFAADVLGVEVQQRGDDAVRMRIDSRSWRIEARRGPRNDVVAAGLEVGAATDLERLEQHLAERGTAARRDAALARERGVTGLSRCTDPSGLEIELFYGATEENHRPLRPPLGHGGFVTGAQGMGHVVLKTPVPERSAGFYCEGLGMAVSDYIPLHIPGHAPAELQFLHCNSRHHTVALLGMPDPKRLAHFMLECRDLDDLGRAFDRVQAADAVNASLGRHTNDGMLSFYAQMPGGIEVEIGFGGMQVEPQAWSVVRHEKTSRWGHVRRRRPPPAAAGTP